MKLLFSNIILKGWINGTFNELELLRGNGTKTIIFFAISIPIHDAPTLGMIMSTGLLCVLMCFLLHTQDHLFSAPLTYYGLPGVIQHYIPAASPPQCPKQCSLSMPGSN